ncbi:hypothetical protein [Pseudomonas alkylphenolica]|uniref:hypothetical protein n=1 Tax=Pseudomonas alkylphenolica TaxID=237609 RepID=UPI0005718051|nr:hypothetical protein [Pseudomonas alkylphenolica]
MSVFKELSHRRAEYNAARMEQLDRLSAQAQRFVGALQRYLGLDSPHWVNPKDGVVMKYVRMGSGSPQNFEEKGRHEFSSVDGVLDFSVAITLENAPDQFPKTHHVFQLEVTAKQGGYEFYSRDFDGSFLVGAAEEADHAYEGVCTAIVNQLKNSYDVGRVF